MLKAGEHIGIYLIQLLNRVFATINISQFLWRKSLTHSLCATNWTGCARRKAVDLYNRAAKLQARSIADGGSETNVFWRPVRVIRWQSHSRGTCWLRGLSPGSYPLRRLPADGKGV